MIRSNLIITPFFFQRQYQQQNRPANPTEFQPTEQQQPQQAIAFDSSAFPTLGGGAQPTQAAMPMPTAMPIATATPTITADLVTAQGDTDAQKQFLGEHLYPKVAAMDQDNAGRIVGMILEAYSQDQIIENLGNEASLKVSVDRAVSTIQEHNNTQQ